MQQRRRACTTPPSSRLRRRRCRSASASWRLLAQGSLQRSAIKLCGATCLWAHFLEEEFHAVYLPMALLECPMVRSQPEG